VARTSRMYRFIVVDGRAIAGFEQHSAALGGRGAVSYRLDQVCALLQDGQALGKQGAQRRADSRSLSGLHSCGGILRHGTSAYRAAANRRFPNCPVPCTGQYSALPNEWSRTTSHDGRIAPLSQPTRTALGWSLIAVVAIRTENIRTSELVQDKATVEPSAIFGDLRHSTG